MTGLISYPIIFSAPMICALLREIEAHGTGKRQTRRLVWKSGHPSSFGVRTQWLTRHDRFQAGERPWLWVREKHWAVERLGQGSTPHLIYDDEWDGAYPDERTPLRPCGLDFGARPSIHMHKWASRLSLRVTDMRMERLQDISREDAVAEGLLLASNHIEEFFRWPEPLHEQLWLSPIAAYESLWNTIHGPGAWADNPEIIAVLFEPHLQNMEALDRLDRGEGDAE